MRLQSHENPELLGDDVNRAVAGGAGISQIPRRPRLFLGPPARARLGFKGEIRAVGDFLYDQINYQHRVGFDAWEVPDHFTVDMFNQRAERDDQRLSALDRRQENHPPASGALVPDHIVIMARKSLDWRREIFTLSPPRSTCAQAAARRGFDLLDEIDMKDLLAVGAEELPRRQLSSSATSERASKGRSLPQLQADIIAFGGKQAHLAQGHEPAARAVANEQLLQQRLRPRSVRVGLAAWPAPRRAVWARLA